MVKLKCESKRHDVPYVWEYKGKAEVHACCPKCGNRVSLKSGRV